MKGASPPPNTQENVRGERDPLSGRRSNDTGGHSSPFPFTLALTWPAPKPAEQKTLSTDAARLAPAKIETLLFRLRTDSLLGSRVSTWLPGVDLGRGSGVRCAVLKRCAARTSGSRSD